MKQEDLPQSLLIISDMEFGDAVTKTDSRLFDIISCRYKEDGYRLPRLIFRNVNSRLGTIPVPGMALVRGFSVNIVKMVLSGEMDPHKCLMEQLTGERYAKITLP